MKLQHYESYLTSSYRLNCTKMDVGEILEGELVSKDGLADAIRIVDSIPRFTKQENYADNFGLQWNRFKSTQLDSVTGIPLTSKRFWLATEWKAEELKGKTVLEVGCGAGRFTEILLSTGAKVVSFDLSSAVDANYQNNAKKGDLFVFQGNIYDIPFPNNYFDYVFCFGVLQHTPDPVTAYREIFSKLRSGGKISIDYYRKIESISPWSTPKYLWRPITSKMKPEKLLKIIRWYIPLYLPIDTFIRKIPKLGFVLSGLIPIPCWNYWRLGFTYQQRLEWAIMDTFDALGAMYDEPKTLEEIDAMVESAENLTKKVFYGSNGIVANITKK